MDILQQKIVELVKWIITHCTKGSISSQEGNTAYTVEGNDLLLSLSAEPNDWFKQILLFIKQVEGSNHWKVSKKLVQRKSLIFHENNVRLLFIWWSIKNCCSLTGTTNLPYSPDIAALDYSFWSSKKFLNKNFKSFPQKTTRTLCLEKIVFRRWNYEIVWKMVEDSETKW